MVARPISMKRPFIISADPPNEYTEPAWWFIFSRRKCSCLPGQEPAVPLIRDLTDLGFSSKGNVFWGPWREGPATPHPGRSPAAPGRTEFPGPVGSPWPAGPGSYPHRLPGPPSARLVAKNPVLQALRERNENQGRSADPGMSRLRLPELSPHLTGGDRPGGAGKPLSTGPLPPLQRRIFTASWPDLPNRGKPWKKRWPGRFGKRPASR